MEHILYTTDLREINMQIRNIKRILQQKAQTNWLAIHNKTKNLDRTKLDLFCKVKSVFGLSFYLSSPLSFKERKALSNFRTSSHNLPVETARYQQITDREHRLCPLCNESVGDEAHYLTECSYETFKTSRAILYTLVCRKSPGFANMSKIDKTVFLLDNTDTQILAQVGKFAHEMMEMCRGINKGFR